LAGAAFFAVAITISLIKLQRAPHDCISCGDSPSGGLPGGCCHPSIAPVR
jgi:hypothetical protein